MTGMPPDRGAVFWGTVTEIPDSGAVFWAAVTGVPPTGAVRLRASTKRPMGAVRPATPVPRLLHRVQKLEKAQEDPQKRSFQCEKVKLVDIW